MNERHKNWIDFDWRKRPGELIFCRPGELEAGADFVLRVEIEPCRTFQGSSLFIPSHIGRSLEVVSLKIGGNEMIIGGPIRGSAMTEAMPALIDFPMARPGMEVSVRIRNILKGTSVRGLHVPGRVLLSEGVYLMGVPDAWLVIRGVSRETGPSVIVPR